MEIEVPEQGEPQIGEDQPEMNNDDEPTEQIPDLKDSPDDQEKKGGVQEEDRDVVKHSEDPQNNVTITEEPEKKEEMERNATKEETKPPVRPLVIPAGIEDEIGHLSGAYPCSNNHIQGTLYAGSEGFAFMGTVFFYTSRFSFKWTKVTNVHHSELGHIVVQVKDENKELSYTFASIQQADCVWASLSAMHSEHNQGSPRNHPLLAPMRASLRRIQTDPTSMQTNSDNDVGDEAAYVAAATAAAMEDVRLSMSSRRMSVAPPEEPESDLEEAWGQLHGNPNESYKDSAFEQQQIACSLDKFHDLFLADDAPYSIARFMTGAGDSNVVASCWRTEGTSSSKSRTIEYTHPINAPLAPPNAKARKEQRMRRFLDQGISMETDTYVDDVPMTDCFYVTDRILVRANDDGTVTISAYFDIRFVKSTMFRSIIANTTRSEFVKWFRNLLEMVRSQALALPSPDEGAVDVTKINTFETSPVETVLHMVPQPSAKATASLTHVLIVLVAILLLFQVYIIHQISGIQTTMLKIQAQQADVCVLPQIVRNAVLNGKECEEVMSDTATQSTNR
jgi:VAD1 Analog of StAR-related lipid transfer domain